jgi:hypothetical protein
MDSNNGKQELAHIVDIQNHDYNSFILAVLYFLGKVNAV